MLVVTNALVVVPAVLRFFTVAYFWFCVTVLLLVAFFAVFLWSFDGTARILERAVAWAVGRVGGADGKSGKTAWVEDVEDVLSYRGNGCVSSMPPMSPLSSMSPPGRGSNMGVGSAGGNGGKGDSGKARGHTWSQRWIGGKRIGRRIVTRGIRLVPTVLEKLDFGAGMRTSGVHVDEVALWIPSWQQPLKLVVSGVKICVVCVDERGRRLDRRSRAYALEEMRHREKQEALRRQALRLIDEILWGTREEEARKGERHPGIFQRIFDTVRGRLLRSIAGIVIRSIHVELKDVGMLYLQHGEPGPRPSLCKYSGRDAVQLKLRNVVLEPKDVGAGRDQAAVSGHDGGDEVSPKAIESLQLGISGISLDLIAYPDTWQMAGASDLPGTSSQSPVRPSRTTNFSFPKYAKAGTSSERKQMEKLQSTIAYTYFELSGDKESNFLSRLALADEEVHRVINQWEVSAVLKVMPSGAMRAEFDQRSSSCHVDPDNFEDDEDQAVPQPGRKTGSGSASTSGSPPPFHADGIRLVPTSPSTFSLTLDVDVKALMLDVNLSSLGIAQRLKGRMDLLSKYNAHWCERPEVPVISHEISWWHHAGRAALKEVRRRVRWQVPLGGSTADGIAQRRANRLLYEPLYVAKHSRNSMFRDPNRRWYQRNTVAAADDASMKVLLRMEEHLSVEEICHFRFMAAAKYNHVLASSPVLKEFLATKVDYVISQLVRGLPVSRAILLHLDCTPVPRRAFGLDVWVTCPKVSLALDTRLHATGEPDSVSYYVLSLKHLFVGWNLAGSTKLVVRSMFMGPADSSTGELSFVSVTSPSQLCRRVCKAADFTRYAVAGHARAENVSSHSAGASFIEVHARPVLGVGGITVDSCGAGLGSIEEMERIKKWKPAGVDIEGSVAAIGAIVTALADEGADFSHVLLRMVGRYRQSNTYMRRWNRAAEPFSIEREEATLNSSTRNMTPTLHTSARYHPLSERYPTMADLVEDSCSRSLTATISSTKISFNTIRIECPGIAFQVPYQYRYSLSRKSALRLLEAKEPNERIRTKARSIASTLPKNEFDRSKYMLTVVVQNIRLHSFADRFSNYYGEGAVQMAEGGFMLDLFSYLSDEERNAITENLAPMKYVFDEDTREFKQVASGVDALKQRLQHLEIVSMAKVWAYPEDASLISKAARSRTLSFRLSGEGDKTEEGADGSETRFPALRVLEKSRYPLPIIPYIKTYGALGCVATRVSGVPLVPGDRSTSAGVLIRGIQAWLSPLQLSHLKCLTETLQRKLKLAGDALEEQPDGKQNPVMEVNDMGVEESNSQTDDPDHTVEYEEPAEQLGRTSRQLLHVKLHVQHASLIWMIGTWASRGEGRSEGQTFVRKSWGVTVAKDDPAYIWGQWLAPLYSVSVSGLKLSLRHGDISGLAVQGSVRAVIARDLQLSEMARHAFMLRPLPARAKRVFDRMRLLRREALGVAHVRKTVQLWKLAIALSVIRRAVDIGELGDSMTQLPSLDDIALDSSGSQFKFDYDSGSRGADQRGRLSIDVGQMLAYIRVKQNASLAAFLGQVSSDKSVDETRKKKPMSKKAGKKSSYQTGLKVVVNMVGLDFTGRFQSSDLFSVRLHQGYLALDQHPVSRFSNPDDIKMHLSAKVDNLSICDLRASQEHQFVLSPSHDASSCGFMIHMTTQVDGTRYAPSLAIDINNPRIILLFRFVRDVLDSISLITTSINGSDADAERQRATVEHDQGIDSVGDAALPLKMTITVQDVDLIVPTSREKGTVLGVSMRALVLALPGVAMPEETLSSAKMPCMDAIVEESILCSSTFLYGDFTREKARKKHDAKPVDDFEDRVESDEHPPQPRGDGEEEVAVARDEQSKPKGRRPSKKRKGKMKKADMLPGVLLFEEQYDTRVNKNARAGVLQLPEDPSGDFDVDEIVDDHDDNILKRSVMFGKPYEILESAFKEVRGQKPEIPARHTVYDQRNDREAINEGVADADEPHEEPSHEEVSEPGLAIVISNMKISSGTMVAIPIENLSDSGAALARTATLATNRQVLIMYEVFTEHQLIEPINMAMAMFERNNHSQLHLSLSEFRIVLSNAVYGTIMDFVGGNLGDFHGSAGDHLVHFKEIRYNRGMKFGPIDSSGVGFRFTLATPEIDCILSAPPTDWMGERSEYVSNIKEYSTVPFFNVNFANFIMNLASMDSGDTYMNFCSTQIDMYDLRLGYRLHKISSDIAAFESETDIESQGDTESTASPSPTRKVTVARKISDHSVKHKDSLQRVDFNSVAKVRADDHILDIQSQNFGVPLIDFTRNPAIKSILGEDVGCYRLLTTDVKMKDRKHVDILPGSNRNIRFEASVGILEDSTMAIEVALSGALIQYPYFHDMSLINGIVGVFKAEEGSEQKHVDGDVADLFADISSWMYFNVIITDTEIFIPVVDVDIALKLIDELWRYSPELRLSEFEKVADVMLATALIHSTDSSAILSLEDRGMAVDMSLLRFCYAMGGDGEIKMTTDLVDVAALIRDPHARVHTVIQPLSASFDLSMQQPESLERHEHKRMTQAAIKIQRAWRQYYLETRTAAKLNAINESLDDGLDSQGSDRQSTHQWKLVEKLALDVATPRTRELLEDYYAGKGQVGSMTRSITKALSVQSINARLGVFTCRMAFSHVAFWKMATDGIAVLTRQVSSGAEEPKVEEEFRPSGVQASASFERLALVLCNDKPETFGAPDVLNICLSDGEASLDMASLLPDRPPNAVGNVSVTLFSSFLNSGSSKWEPMLNPWPVRAEFVDANGSGFASDRKLHFWLSSEVMMDSTFNPASLMSVGDLLSFVNMIQSPEMPLMAYREGSAVDETDVAIKSMSTKGMASRAPQKYLIQNQSGLKLYYWTEDPSQSSRKSPVIGLDPEASDTLKVIPCHKKLALLNFTASSTGTERLGAVINLHFEGNWMPIRDVPINVIGKYKYNMTSPADNTVMPVIVDVILVGRTKIITVHSGIWVENSIEIPISFRLHVPTTSLVPPGIIKRKQRLSTEGDVLVGPLKPGEGVYLPLVASLGGLLFLQPADYQEATRDVIRLSIDVTDLINQQGYIVCNSLDLPGVDDHPLHVTMEVTPSKVLSEFQTFKHMEVIGPGTLQRATSALEVTISIQPTMVFNNAMPYGMNVLLWQIGVSDDKMGGDFMDMISPRGSIRAQPRPDAEGRYFAFHVPPGGEASIYADVRKDILAHVSFEEVNMRTVKWTLCNPSWNAKVDLKERLDRMPGFIPLRMLDVGLQLPTEAFGIEQYLERLKLGLSKLRSVHAQLKRNARKAVTARDISRQVAKIKTMTKRRNKSKKEKGKKRSGSRVAPPQTVKRAAPTSARPIPPQSQGIPASSPPSNFNHSLNEAGVKKKKGRGLLRGPDRGVAGGDISVSVELRRPESSESDIHVVDGHESSSEAHSVLHTSPYADGASRGLQTTPEYMVHRPPPLNIDIESDSSEDSLESSSEKNRMVAPAILNVCMHTSLADKDIGSVSRVSFFVPFWLNNRTGVDLFFKDTAASSHPLGFNLPWEYLEVFAPGTSLTDDLDRAQDRLETDGGSALHESEHRMNNQVVLMNQQEDLSLGLAHVSNRKYSQPVGIKTVGNKGTVELKGPMYKAKPGKGKESALKGIQAETMESQEEEISPMQVIAEANVGEAGIDEADASGTHDAIGAMKVAAAATTRGNSGEEDHVFATESEVKLSKFTQRSFEFAVDVSAAPRRSMFRNTKLINLKPKYIVENQTGIAVDIKQFGTADPEDHHDTADEGHRRFARTLPHGSRAAVYWDDAQLAKEITIRPRLDNENPDDWNWSGAFPLPDTEWYFGLRLRHSTSQRRYVNIPVNVTVGSSGSIQVTLKKPTSVPPYRIENLCKEVQLFFVQVPLVFRVDGKQYVDCLNPREVMPYAWDEPTLLPKLRVQAKFSGRQESRVADYSLDVLGDAVTLLLPTQEEREAEGQGRLYRSLSNEMPDELKQKLVSLLAAEFSKKVYATVYADGPTRVLRFSDDRNLSSSEHKHVVLDLAFRLKQMEYEMRDVNGQFARLGGMQSHHYFSGLDLYGRYKDDFGSEEQRSRELITKTLRKMPVPETTQQVVKQASRQIFSHSRSQSLENMQVDTAELLEGNEGTPARQTSIRFLEDNLTPASTSKYSGTMNTVSDVGDSAKGLADQDRYSGSISWKDPIRDVGHLGGGDSLVPSRSARRRATFHSSEKATNINKRQELLKSLIVGDANLLVGGDLNITVVQAQNLSGAQRTTHSFARVRVRDAIPPADDTDRSKQTSVIWQSLDPIWDEQLVFKDVCVASELVVELWDLGGSRPSNHILHPDSSEVIKTCRFLGRAEIPLTETLDVPAMTALWYPLMRRTASDEINGRLQLRFHWDVSTRGLMSIKLLAMESVLAQRREILAALQPVQSSEALAWAKVNPVTFAGGSEGHSKQVMPTIGQEMFQLRGEDTFNRLVFNPSESSLAVLNRHAHDHRQRHLVVTVLEARGLNPRSGVVVALSDNELPNPVVTIKLEGYPSYSTAALSHTLNPRWPANQRHIFRGVDPANAELSVTISDERNGLIRREIPLGRGIVHASNLKGTRPTYIWVPAFAVSKKKKLAGAAGIDEHTIPDLQVFLRLQWQRKVDRGSSTKLEMDLAGAGMMVVGGLQDELFNLTLESLKLESITAAHEKTIQGSVASIQLDNQTLNAGEPVVLAPDVGLRPGVEPRPVVKFVLTQTFGASIEASNLEKDLARVEGCAKVARKIGKVEEKGADIRSYKKFSLSIDPLHLQTDEVFMEQVLSFLSSVPTGDIWQDEAWREQQYLLLTAQFGPREVEALAINAPTASKNKPRGSSDDILALSPGSNKALFWVREKEGQDMMAMQGQSDLSSWFFIESAEISQIKVNVSIALSSRLLAAGSIRAEEDEFSRALGASGYQLVNVSKVEISLGKWLLGSSPSYRGKRTSNGFLSQRALISNLARHYTREGLKEAHKVLGGSGPAVASVPLAVLWAGGSAVVLLHEAALGKAGPIGVVRQVFYVPVMTVSMFFSGFSRMFAAGMALLPPTRIHGDNETVRRLVQRPTNAIDALMYMPKELVYGFTDAGKGILYDPIAGWHNGNVPGFFVGLLKGVIGLPVRPIIGICEATSDLTGAIAMASLGREGIVGRTLRRVKAPGAFLEDTILSLDADGIDESPSRGLVAAWQRVLLEFFPEMVGEEVQQVMNVRPTRVLLFTTTFVAYLKAKHLLEHSVYRPKWVIPAYEIQNIQGDPDSRKISIAHVRKFDLKVFGVWPVQMKKGLRCENRSLFDRTVLRLTKVQQAAQTGRPIDDGGKKYRVPKVHELTMLNDPYRPPGEKTVRIEEMD